MERAMGGACRFAGTVANTDSGGCRIADFRALLGEAAWERLPAAVRERFAFHSHAVPVVYRGRMRVHATWLGRAFAQWWRLFDTPVAPFVGDAVPVEVRVFELEDHSGTVWERCYHFPGRAVNVVRSIKQLDDDGTLIETLGAGLHMRLQVRELAGALHFISAGYFVRMGSLRCALPAWFPPGRTCVLHEDRGGGRFRFVLRTTHPWFGDMFIQEGEFE